MNFKAFKDISLPRLGMGNMRLPTMGQDRNAPIDRAHAQSMIDYCMANGVNYFDTAYPYHAGESERFLGEALKKYSRESCFLATKYFILANPDYKAVFEEQLARLQTDHVDFYMIHGIFDHTWKRYIDEGAVKYFIEQKEAGRIKYLGFSSHASLENLTTFVEHHAWDFCQIQLNYFDAFYGSAMQEYEILRSRGIPVIAMEPVRGGRLATLSAKSDTLLRNAHPDWSVSSWALRWVASLDGVQVVLSGMSTLEQLKENIALFEGDHRLSVADEQLLRNAADAFRSSVMVPCTECRYCVEEGTCPADIDIPAVLKLYNAFKVDGPWALQGMSELTVQPDACVECGECSDRCPQSIGIPAFMKELAEAAKNTRR